MRIIVDWVQNIRLNFKEIIIMIILRKTNIVVINNQPLTTAQMFSSHGEQVCLSKPGIYEVKRHEWG